MKCLIVVDMQNDFVSGSLGGDDAKSIVDNVVEKVKNFDGEILFTRDTHEEDYLNSMEGKNLPVEHCIKGTIGWEIIDELKKYALNNIIDKPTFGSISLIEALKKIDDKEKIESITFVGLCTDICVISNAIMAKANFYDIEIIVDGSCCAGVTKESHDRALEAMKMCHIKIE